MQVKRDTIHGEVMPAVNETAPQYGDTVELVDLRSGIDASWVDVSAVLNSVRLVCIDAINGCNPSLFIC